MRYFVLLLALTSCSKPPDHEKAFEERMKNVTLVGYSTRTNKEGTFGPERYKIESVSKLAGETWMFKSKVNYNGSEISVPIPITVKWAGKAAVITLEDLAIPAIGTWTAHIVLSGDQYAGTWSGKRGGGQMFGKIVKE